MKFKLLCILISLIGITKLSLVYAHSGHEHETDDNHSARQQAAMTVKGKDIVINGETLPYSVLVGIVLESFPIWDKATIPAQVKYIQNNQIDLTILAQTATKEGVDSQVLSDAKLNEFKSEVNKQDQRLITSEQRLQILKRNYLAKAYLDKYSQSIQVDESLIQKQYEATVQQVGNKALHLRRLRVNDLVQAAQVKTDFEKGVAIDDLVKRYSTDIPSRTNGGDLGWNLPGAFAVDQAKIIQSLQDKQFSQPIAEANGYVLFYVEASRPNLLPTYAENREYLIDAYKRKQVNDLIAKLRAQSQVE